MDPTHSAVIILVLLIMIVGLIGTVVPVLPGLPLIWAGALVYGLLWEWGQWGPWLFAAMTLLTVAGYIIGLVLTHVGAAAKGASWQALLASLALGTVGFFVIPVVGALIGAVLGVFLVEYRRRKDAQEAWRATTGAILGFGLGFGIEVACGLAIVVLWGVWVWAG
jgi:uncharacterized protein YqgC (DUF456 family)